MVKRIRIVFVRHGETEANFNNILQGCCDFPLTTLGEDQAISIGSQLKRESWAKVFSSDLPRTKRTTSLLLGLEQFPEDEESASEVNKKLGYSVVAEPLIRELNFGVREKLPRGTTVEEAIAIRSAEAGCPVVDTAETIQTCIIRLRKFLRKLHDDPEIWSTFNGEITNGEEDDEFVIDEAEIDELVAAGEACTPTMLTNDEDFDSMNENDSEIPSILCISHGGLIRRFLGHLCQLHGYPRIENCSVSVVNVIWRSPNKPHCFAELNKVSQPYVTPEFILR